MWRGRGRGGGGQRRYVKPEEYHIFPEIKELPDVNLKRKEEEYRSLVSWGNDLQKFWISSPYHMEPVGQDAERNEGKRKAPLSDYIMMTDQYVPAELVSRNVRHSKKIRWDPQSDLQRLDIFEKLDRGSQVEDEGDREKKEDEEEEEDDENVEEEEEDELGDYEQNIDFDDDEDDYNQQDDGGGDEGCF